MVEQRGTVADRQCVRVTLPRELFREAALWVRPPGALSRVHLLEIGRPDLRFSGDSPAVHIDDISANGLRITLRHPQDLGDSLALLKSGACLVYLYLKLAQPLSALEERPLSLFLGVTPVAVREEDGQLVVAVGILYRGQPDRDDKSVTFFYVAKYPIRELTVWCDEVTLMDRPPLRPAEKGLHMDRFMLELDTLLAQAQPSASPKKRV